MADSWNGEQRLAARWRALLDRAPAGVRLDVTTLPALAEEMVAALTNSAARGLLPTELVLDEGSQIRRDVVPRFLMGTLTPYALAMCDENAERVGRWYVDRRGADPFADLRARMRHTFALMAREVADPTWPLGRLAEAATLALKLRNARMVELHERGFTAVELARVAQLTPPAVGKILRRGR